MQNSKLKVLSGLFATCLCVSFVTAADLEITMHKLTATGLGESIGTVTFRDSSEHGLLIIPKLHDLNPGQHGFHIHEHPACGPQTKAGKQVVGGAAGGHYDPKQSGHHMGPVGEGHKGDLPALLVDAKGNATLAMFAPHLQVPDLLGRALMVHAEGDNYADEPKPLGGGGARVACGVIGVDGL